MAQCPRKRLDHVRDAIRLTHDSRQTEEASVTRIKRILARTHCPLPRDQRRDPRVPLVRLPRPATADVFTS
jgi:hypothetical protein